MLRSLKINRSFYFFSFYLDCEALKEIDNQCFHFKWFSSNERRTYRIMMKKLNRRLLEKSHFQHEREPLILVFLAFLQGEDHRARCSSRIVFKVIMRFFLQHKLCPQTNNNKKTSNIFPI